MALEITRQSGKTEKYDEIALTDTQELYVPVKRCRYGDLKTAVSILTAEMEIRKRKTWK